MHFGKVHIGFGGSQTALHKKCAIENNGIMVFGEKVNVGGGAQICTVNNHSELQIGDDTSITGESHIVAKKRIEIGNDCLISWNTQIMDSDLHNIVVDNMIVNRDKDIHIGNHVWIGSNVIVLKGTYIPNGTIVAAGSIIQGQVENENSCITGMPVRIIKSNTIWKHTDNTNDK